MKILLAAVIFGAFLGNFVICEKKFDFYFIKTVELNDTKNDIYDYKIKKIEKINDTSFMVNADFEQLQDLSDSWEITIEVFHNDKGEEEFEKVFLKVPKTGVCEFMKTVYKKHFYENLKEKISNAPEPETCPVVKAKYEIEKYVFNGDRYVPLARVGMWRIDVFISKDGETLRGNQYFVKVEPKEE